MYYNLIFRTFPVSDLPVKKFNTKRKNIGIFFFFFFVYLIKQHLDTVRRVQHKRMERRLRKKEKGAYICQYPR